MTAFDVDDRDTWPKGDGPWVVICMGDDNGDTIAGMPWLPTAEGPDPMWVDEEVVEYVWIGSGRDYAVDLATLASGPTARELLVVLRALIEDDTLQAAYGVELDDEDDDDRAPLERALVAWRDAGFPGAEVSA